MKKNKKGLIVASLYTLAIICSIFVLPMGVKADIIQSDIMPFGTVFGELGPEAYSGESRNSSVYNITSDGYDSVTIGQTSVMFNNRGSLRSDVCVEDNSRKMVVTLMEDDLANADDVVKEYTWSFDKLQMTSVVISPFTSSTLIDSSGDNRVELYLKQYLDYRAGDVTGTTNGPMYYFDLYVN